MIQLNLLPDVKLEYIKAQQTRRLVITVSVLVTAGAIAILVVLLLFDLGQKVQLDSVSSKIKKESATLQGKPQINKILTVQNQLESLTALHATKPAASNLFKVLNEVTPSSVSINSFSGDFTAQTVTITGSADALSDVNTFIDTLKYTTYTTDSSSKTAKAFGNIVLTSFGLNSGAKNIQPASYAITFAYDKNIFDITQNAKLIVPSQTTTRASINQSQTSDLFQGPAPKTTTAPAPVATPTKGSQ